MYCLQILSIWTSQKLCHFVKGEYVKFYKSCLLGACHYCIITNKFNTFCTKRIQNINIVQIAQFISKVMIPGFISPLVENCFNPFPNKPWFLCVCCTSLLTSLWEKEKLLNTSNFSFSHSVFYPFRGLSTISIKLKIAICKLFRFGRV